jgi:excisionase family DNA binding protein
MAKATSRVLASHLQDAAPVELRLADGTPVALPAPALRLLVDILEEMGRGSAVTVIPVQRELTTQQAADLLQISRPSLIQLLEKKKLEYRRIGTHRRVALETVMTYKRQQEEARRRLLAELAAYDQELGSEAGGPEVTLAAIIAIAPVGISIGRRWCPLYFQVFNPLPASTAGRTRYRLRRRSQAAAGTGDRR